MPFDFSIQGRMKAWSYGGFHVFDGAGAGHLGTVCEEHFSKMFPGFKTTDDWVWPIFATDEADSYPVCEYPGCGVVFDYINLTEEGEAYEAMYREEGMRTVKIEVDSGILNITEAPDDVRIIVRDYDWEDMEYAEYTYEGKVEVDRKEEYGEEE